ncbi:hypothetical protein [Streptomyces candidus]|uniref:Uncharacterized protein n=1 Tax=Streptomyces candidus TaxID=67283 RepID=A0A7X0HKR1_9ACTN|nr:hypothetical protein [Streptomyces candidus]MBB6439376.1 hypothetical protein [Streptomyces candidus]
MSEASSTSLRMAVEAARAAAKAAAHTAALILIEADGGRGSIHNGSHEQHGDTWCVVRSAHFTAHILSESHGDRAHVSLDGITPAAYERMRAWAEDRDFCRHDHNCECLTAPWPTFALLAQGDEEHRIDYRADYEYERGSASLAFNRVTVTLFDEPVTVVDTLLRIARATA